MTNLDIRSQTLPPEEEGDWLVNLRMNWKLLLLIAAMTLGIISISATARFGLTTLRTLLNNSYDFVVVPIVNIKEAETALTDADIHFEELKNPTLTSAEMETHFQAISADEAIAQDAISRYDSEWVTTLRPESTNVLRMVGRPDLQREESSTLAALHSAYDKYIDARKTYEAAVRNGNADSDLESTVINALLETRGHLRQLIEINLDFADLSNLAAKISFTNSLQLILVVLVQTTALGLYLAFIISRSIVKRLNSLQQAATKVQDGILTERIEVAGQDEIAFLSNAFNSMATQLNDTLANLESRVAARTTDLETVSKNSERRAKQFEAIAQVARAIASIQDLDILLPRVTQLISQQFGFYHAGIFLVDDKREYAVLMAANSEGGKKMLAREHRLKVGQTGIVGYVTGTGNPRIALDTGTDAVFFDNPDLPGTHSEMALPLRVADNIIGALDVQSVESNAFKKEDVEVLSTLADQVSIAIQNARSFSETRKLLAESESAISGSITEAWKTLRPISLGTGYQKAGSSIKPLDKPLEGEHIQQAVEKGQTAISSSRLAVPIRLRGQVIGIMNLQVPENHNWNPDEVDIAEAVAERLSLAIETATLLQATQRRADIERVTADISGKIGSSTRFETILQTAAQELSRALGGSDVLVQIEPISMKMSSSG